MVDLSEARNGLDGLAANGATAATLEGGAAAGGGDPSAPAGLVLGTEDAAATPLGFSVFVDPERYLQLDDVVYASSPLPGGGEVDFYGVVDEVCAVQEGVRFASDVALASAGVLPAEPAVTAHVAVTRVEPEIFVPPRPGVTVRLARGEARDRALFFDAMRTKLPFGLSRDGEPVYANLEFLDGTRGAHVNISGISGVATKTSYAMFLLHTLFESGALGHEAANTRSLIFNVKGEDLLFLDRPNAELTDHDRARYARLGLPAEPFHSVALFAPVRRGDQPVPETGSRLDGVTGFYWTLREFCAERYMRFLFADADDERSQLGLVVQQVETQLALAARLSLPLDAPTVEIGGELVTDFDQLVEAISTMTDPDAGGTWGGRAAPGTVQAFLRRLEAAKPHVGHLIRRVSPPRTPQLTASTGRGRRPRSSTSTACTTAPSASSSASCSSGCSSRRRRAARRGRSSSSCSTSSTSTRRARAAARSRTCCSTSPSAAARWAWC